jgi:hypothetical protein
MLGALLWVPVRLVQLRRSLARPPAGFPASVTLAVNASADVPLRAVQEWAAES